MARPGGRFIVTVDGPAGSGKSTVSRLVADELGFVYLDTGAMYRAVTWKAMSEGVDLTDTVAVARIARGICIEFRDGRIFVDGRDVTGDIRMPDVTGSVYRIADMPEVRRAMLLRQRSIAGNKGVVAEGRDIGTVVFPDAEKKFYLDASVGERAGRRYRELKEKGLNVSLEKIEKEIAERDAKDMNRKIAPLAVADGAVVIDTSDMGIMDVVKTILKIARDE